MPRNNYAESAEQISFFRELGLRRYNGGALRRYCYAVPNAGVSGGRRAMLAGARRKAEGLTAGVPDVECFIARHPFTGWHGEFKRVDGKPSDVTDSQRDVMALLTAEGRKCDVCFGAEDGMKKLMAYLGL